MIQLYDHQVKIIQDDKKKIGLWLGCGGGKTLTALMLAKDDTLVICPKTIREEGVWEKEHMRLSVNSSFLYDPINLRVMSKEEFRRDAINLLRYDTVIVDEAHTCLGATPNVRYVNKEPIPKTSQLFEELDAYIKRTEPDRIYLATATIIRSPMTVWAAAKILGYEFNFYQWRHQFYVKLPMPGREVWMPKKDKQTKELLAQVVQKLGYVGQISDWFDMPTQNFKKDMVELTEAQKGYLKWIALDFPEPIVQVGKRHQIENGVLAGDEFSAPKEFKNEKIEKILDYCIEFPRFVVWARYTAQIEAIRAAIESTGKKVLTLTGQTKDRKGILSEARASDDCVLICQSAISEGWELSDWNVMVFASLDWSVVSYVQALGRINRVNNLKKNLYIHLVARGGIDEYVYKTVVEQKMDFHEAMFQIIK